MITSTSNAKVKRLVNLKKKKKLRDEEGVFLVEGIRMFREVPKDRLVEVYASEEFWNRERKAVEQVLAGRKCSRRFWQILFLNMCLTRRRRRGFFAWCVRNNTASLRL